MKRDMIVRYLEEVVTGILFLALCLVYVACFAVGLTATYLAVDAGSVPFTILGVLMVIAVIEPVALLGCTVMDWKDAQEKLDKVDNPPPNCRRFYTEGRVLEVSNGPVELTVHDGE